MNIVTVYCLVENKIFIHGMLESMIHQTPVDIHMARYIAEILSDYCHCTFVEVKLASLTQRSKPQYTVGNIRFYVLFSIPRFFWYN